MNDLLSGVRGRVVLVSLLSTLTAVTGLGLLPESAAAPHGQISGTVTDEGARSIP